MSLPLSTYRVQMRSELGFDAVAALAEYLSLLGVTHLYASPYWQAQPGSTHGYDVIDHARPSEEMGGPPAHGRMCRALAEHGLGQIIDIVPNHMSIGSRLNRWWWDVLENGQASRYASYFDVDWHPPEERLRNLVVLPILGNHVGRVLDNFEIRLVREGSAFNLQYHDHLFPVAPASLTHMLRHASKRVKSDELAFIADVLERLRLPTNPDRKQVVVRHRDKEVLRGMIERLCRDQPRIAQAIDDVIAETNADPQSLGLLLDQQNYRLAYWRTASEELVYRRFFDINSLVSLRMEDDQVFEDTHALALSWIEQGMVDGLRIDHPDGLRDPEAYFTRLRERAPESWLVVEKILQPKETLPTSWPVHGTTGYDFLNQLAGLFVDPAGEEPLTQFYQAFTGETRAFEQCVYDGKQQVLREAFAADVHRLTSLVVEICERHAHYRDYTRKELRQVVQEIIASYPVYRTYARAHEQGVHATDRQYINQAIDHAREKLPDIEADLFEFIRQLLLLELDGDLEHDFAMRFQQATGAAVAKGVEDTAFYNFNRFLALNEVGGDPGTFGISLERFHSYCQQMQAEWPLTMLTTTTHDTKRSEDVRARLYLLSEIPERWRSAVERWSDHNLQYKQNNWPDANFEYALYQTLFGAWPISVERANVFAIKAVREAKVHTSWVAPQADYEASVTRFVERILADEVFTHDLQQFIEEFTWPGQVNALSQVLAKLTCPGVPDIYQGNEVWNFSLVDPDNRRLVDFAARQHALQVMRDLSLDEILQRTNEGFPKLWLTRQALHLRKRRPELFGAESSYVPQWATGTHGGAVLAYRRGEDCLVAAPLRVLRTWGRWEDTRLHLPDGTWHNELTGERHPAGEVPVAQLWRKFPVALLVRH